MLGAGTRDLESHLRARKLKIGVAAEVPPKEPINLTVRAAMKPSSDMLMLKVTFPMFILLSVW